MTTLDLDVGNSRIKWRLSSAERTTEGSIAREATVAVSALPTDGHPTSSSTINPPGRTSFRKKYRSTNTS